MENSTSQVFDNIANKNNASPWSIAMKFGIVGGAFYIVSNLIQYLSGMMDMERMAEKAAEGFNFGSIMTGLGLVVLNWVVFTAIYYLAIAAYRKELGGFITFGQGFKVAFFSVLVKSAVIFFWSLIFFYVICPDFCEGMLNFMGQALQEAGTMDDDMMDMMMNFYSYLYNPISMSIMGIMSTISGGAILSLVAAMLGQKEPTY